MPFIVRLANHLRSVNPKNLFCLVEFGDEGYIAAFSSGKAMWLPREQQIDGPVYFHENNSESNKDGEERMTHEFPDMYARFGRKTEDLTIFTAASPCSRVCATAILHLAKDIAEDDAIPVRTITILYHKEYHSKMDEEYGGVAYTLEKLNQTVGNVAIKCVQLYGEFIDPRTIHGSWS